MSSNPALTENFKQRIASNFDRAASYYEKHGLLQKNVAERLIASLQPWKDIIPSGPIVELGCGTGFVTEGLAELYPDREIRCLDLSKEMLSICRNKFSNRGQLSFSIQDAEQQPIEEPKHALTVSGFAAHWFENPAMTLGKWLEGTKPGGLLLASFLGSESFPEWKAQCRELGLPFTGNQLPDVEEMVVKMSVGPAQVDYYEDTVTQTYDSALDFFRELKRLGGGTRQKGRSLSAKEFSLLVDHWDSSNEDKVKVSYHLVFIAVKRD